MVFPIAGGNESKGFDVENSLRFNDNDSPLLTRTPGTTATDRKKATISFWFKIGNITDSFRSLYRFNDGSGTGAVYLRSGNDLQFAWEASSSNIDVRPDGVFRDPSAWYHAFIRFDTTQSTAADRVEIYINGVERTYSTANYPNQNDTVNHLTSDKTYYIGGDGQSSDKYFDGYIAEFNVVDGQAKSHLDFGEFNDNGVWIPKKYIGTYGNNGFHLEFKQTGTSANSSGIGADTSGNDKHFTVTNLAALDVTEDTCTNNFATLVPALNMTLSEGNVKAMTSRTGNWDAVHASIGLTSGKWYFETKASTSGTFRVKSGVSGDPENFTFLFNGQGGSDDPLSSLSNTYPSYGKGVWLEHWYDQNYNSSSTASSQSSGDILQFALDLDNYKLWVGINGQFKDNSNNNVSYSDVASGSSATVTIASAAYTGKTFFPDVWLRDDSGSDDNIAEINFGNPSYSISSGNADANGHGNFEYAVPTGHFAICTKNLAEEG